MSDVFVLDKSEKYKNNQIEPDSDERNRIVAEMAKMGHPSYGTASLDITSLPLVWEVKL